MLFNTINFALFLPVGGRFGKPGVDLCHSDQAAAVLLEGPDQLGHAGHSAGNGEPVDFKAPAAFDDARNVLLPDDVVKVQGFRVGFAAVSVGPVEGAVDAQFFKADFGSPGGV